MKKILTTLTLMMLCAAMTACTATANDVPMTNTTAPMLNATASPTTMIDGVEDMLLPDATNGLTAPMTTEDPEVTGVTTVSTARRAVEQIEDELERLSEVSDAEVVLAGNSAAVALKFDSQYKGGIDDRLTEIVKERIAGDHAADALRVRDRPGAHRRRDLRRDQRRGDRRRIPHGSARDPRRTA